MGAHGKHKALTPTSPVPTHKKATRFTTTIAVALTVVAVGVAVRSQFVKVGVWAASVGSHPVGVRAVEVFGERAVGVVFAVVVTTVAGLTLAPVFWRAGPKVVALARSVWASR